jgi:hypothetical protein
MDLSGYKPLRCPTPSCDFGQIRPVAAEGWDRIELSTGPVPTVVWRCSCGYSRKEIMHGRREVVADGEEGFRKAA